MYDDSYVFINRRDTGNDCYWISVHSPVFLSLYRVLYDISIIIEKIRYLMLIGIFMGAYSAEIPTTRAIIWLPQADGTRSNNTGVYIFISENRTVINYSIRIYQNSR